MKPLIIGMGPSPDEKYRGEPWFPLAPTSRSLSKLIFDRWTAFPEVEHAFDLTNLNQRCHQQTTARGRERDCVHPLEASETIIRLTAEGVFAQKRQIFLLGNEVAKYVRRLVPVPVNAHLVELQHPSILCAPWKWPSPGDGRWRSTVRNKLRASIGLPDLSYEGPADEAPDVLWADFARENWISYAKRYGLELSKEEWIKLLSNDIKRMKLDEAEKFVENPIFDVSSESRLQISDLHQDMDDWSRSFNEGWYHSDDD